MDAGRLAAAVSDLEARLQSIGPDPFMVDLQRFGTHLPEAVAAGLVGAVSGAAPGGQALAGGLGLGAAGEGGGSLVRVTYVTRVTS